MSRWGPAALASGVDLARLRRTLETGARLMNVAADTTVVLTLTSDAHIKEYNRRYRGLDEPTDVLAFSARETPTDQRFVPPPGTERWLGDIVISMQQARAPANAAHHDLEAELRLLAVHGFLHLLGYDHEQASEERAMTALTNRILAAA